MKSVLLYILCFSVPLHSFAAVSAGTGPVDQRNSQQKAERVEYDGSDDSMEHATTRAMIALGCLSALAIGCAFANGYKAYDHYLNSEEMDRIEAKAKTLKSSMDSVGKSSLLKSASKGGAFGKDKGDSWVSFSRLDPGFLYKGEAGQVAEEFEKRSGLKREQFLGVLSSITDSELNFDDPGLFLKANSIWNDFVGKIPNQDFKDGLIKAAEMIPENQRQQVFNDALGKVYAMGSEKPGGNSSRDSTLAVVNEGAATVLAGGGGAPFLVKALDAAFASSKSEIPSSIAINSTAPARISKQAFGLFIGLESNDRSPLDGLMQASRLNADDDGSIFTKISRRYRLIAPLLQSGVKSVN